MADSSSGDDADQRSREELNQRLHDAADAGDVEKLRQAIAAGADPNALTERGHLKMTALCSVVRATRVKHNRAVKGRTACVRALLDAGASASAAVVFFYSGDSSDSEEQEEQFGYTAMHDAVCSGLDTICRLLLDAGAALNTRDFDDTTPLQYAAGNGHHRTAVLLLSRGAVAEEGKYDQFLQFSPGYLSRIERAGSFANYQKQQCKKLTAMLAPKMDHLLPPELVSHVITFWGHLGWN